RPRTGPAARWCAAHGARTPGDLALLGGLGGDPPTSPLGRRLTYWAPPNPPSGRGTGAWTGWEGARAAAARATRRDTGGVGEIKVGTASWTDRTLLASGWYPESADTPERRLAYYAEQFPLVEVDSTYYSPPAEQTVSLWVARTPPEFTFNIKAFSLLTGHPTRPAAIYKDLRPETDKSSLYPGDLPAQAYEEVWTRFLSALDPLASAGKLGAILFQFPPWFTIRRANKDYLREVVARCRPLRVAVEFRHESWFRGDNQRETLEFLRAHQIPYVCVDMPQGYRSSVPPVLAATADLALVRFHGHSD